MPDTLDPAERADLATQIGRLNDNIERQFELIEAQRTEREQRAERERKMGRRRWYGALVVALLIVVGNVRIEVIRNETDRRQCEHSNAARSEILTSFDGAFQTIEHASLTPEQRDRARQVGKEVHARLEGPLAPQSCGHGSLWPWSS